MYKICHFSVVMCHSFYYCNTELPIAPQKFFIFSNFFEKNFVDRYECVREKQKGQKNCVLCPVCLIKILKIFL